MSRLRSDPLGLVWLALVAATVVSWMLAGDRRPEQGDILVTAVVAIGFLKAWVVGRAFMELQHARPLVRRAFDGWAVGSVVLVAAMQHLA